MTTHCNIIELPGLTIDISAIRSVFSTNGYPQWAGKVVLILQDSIDPASVRVAANWAGREESAGGTLCDFEGESEDPTIYEACEAHAVGWAARISERLGRPSHWDAHHNDLRDRGIIAT